MAPGASCDGGYILAGNLRDRPYQMSLIQASRDGNFDQPIEHALENPLGARALYLFQGKRDTLFRIHGTNEPDTIGRAVSSGCVRMMNADVIDLYKRVGIGTRVVVL